MLELVIIVHKSSSSVVQPICHGVAMMKIASQPRVRHIQKTKTATYASLRWLDSKIRMYSLTSKHGLGRFASTDIDQRQESRT